MKNTYEILKFPDSRLRRQASCVENITPELKKLAQDMLSLMYKEGGVGLAAVQINKGVRLFVANTAQETDRYEDSRGTLEKEIKQPLIFFNPEIKSKEGSVVFNEGCLSFPSYAVEVKRSETVRVEALNEEGKPFSIKTDGLLSICIQHEIDHLNGKLFIDHLSRFKAQRLADEIKKYGYPKKET